ncbi:MAG TPA: ABC transporter permease, partial [Bryobacteraceae bacterium]|nr:ABC transporter permease [Bryobacteraceae bacterium]
MESLASDLKQAFRSFRKNPAFTATAVAALALGIGANTAIFSVVNTVLLKPLPYPDADRIVVLMNTSPTGSGQGASVPKFNIWRQQTQALEDVSAYDTNGPGLNLSGSDHPEQIKGMHVSQPFFHLFGARTLLGRTFTAEEDRPRGGHVAVLSYGLWQRRYGSDPSIVGRTIALGGEAVTIV